MNITYLFGAGASIGALPIVNQIPVRIEGIISLMERGDFSLSDKESYKESSIAQYSKKQIQEWFIDDLRWLLEKTKNHASIDTFAKKLYITSQKDDLVRLKNSFSVFLILEQALNKTNMRYDSFFASILKKTYHPLPANIKIISWNYDYQFEKAYSEYSGQNRLSSNQKLLNVFNKYTGETSTDDKNDKFTIIKLNGSSNIINTEWRRLSYFNDNTSEEFSINLIDKTLNSYAILRFASKYIYSGMSFAWESSNSDYQKDVIQHTKEITKDTNILIVIGYSFPYFNRDIDQEIILNMNNLLKVYFQSPDAENLKERFLSVRDDIEDSQLIIRKNCDQFLLPNEL